MQRSYLDYAMCVIVSRALPDVRDGLKPVHRRVLYAMYDGGYRPDRSFYKCARVVGDVMGNYHPHGDSAIYDTLVRLAQPWALRYPLVDGQGNFGSPGNDPAAAMRYCVTGDTLRAAEGRHSCASPRSSPEPAATATPTSTSRSWTVRRPGRGHHGVPLRRAPHAAPADTGGLRGHRDAQPPRPDPASVWGVPTLLWRLLEEIQPGDRVGAPRPQPYELGDSREHERPRRCSPAPGSARA